VQGPGGKGVHGAKAFEIDPMICATAYGKSRFYLFSRREPKDGAEARDVLNEKPQNEGFLTAATSSKARYIHVCDVTHSYV